MSTPETPNQLPPVPRYGEYAPPGTVPPPYSAEPAASQPPFAPPAQPAPYYAQPAQPAAYYAQPPTERPRRTWDLVLSVILLVIGFFGVLFAILNALTIDMQMVELYKQYGASGSYEPGASAAIVQAVIIISHIVLYAVAAIFTIVLIRKRRVAFWLPLSIGALAGIVFFGAFMALILADPNLLEVITQQSAP